MMAPFGMRGPWMPPDIPGGMHHMPPRPGYVHVHVHVGTVQVMWNLHGSKNVSSNNVHVHCTCCVCVLVCKDTHVYTCTVFSL